MMADRERIKRNIARMLEQGAPEVDIDAYLADEGVTSEELRGAPVSSPADPLGTLVDVGKSFGTGVQQGMAGMLGLPGDIRSLAAQGIEAATGYELPEMPSWMPASIGGLPTGAKTTADLQGGLERLGVPVHEPETTAGKYAKTVGEFAPGLAGGPGGLVRRGLTQVAAPAVASEAAGQAAEGGRAEPFARIVGALAGGVAGIGAGNAVNRARSYVPGMKAGASRTLEKTVSPDAEARLAELGPQGFLMESTPATFGVAQGIATRPGAAQNTLVGAVKGRQQGANARLAQDLDETLGQAVAPSRIESSLDQQRQSLSELYEQVAGLNEPVNLQPIAEQLRMAIPAEAGATQQALRRVLDMIAPETGGRRTLRTRPREVLNVRQALDDELTRLGEQQPKAYRAVLGYRSLVDDALAEAVPDIKVLDQTFANLKRESEALAQGGQVMQSGKTGIRPEDLIAERAAMPAPQRAAQRAAARAEIDRLVGTKANDVTALKQLVMSEGDWNRVKLAEVFGAKEAEKILQSIDREAAFQDAYRKMVENSMTAQRLGGAKLVEAETAEAPSMRDLTLTGIVASTGQKVARGVKDAISSGRRAAADEELASALVTQGPQRDRLLRAIINAKGKREKGRSKTRDLLINALIGTSAATTGARN